MPVISGSWTDPWTGTTYTLAAEVDIDHTVALANAHRSGGWAWDTDDKRAFANDMTNPAALRAMGKSANIAKSDKGPDEWRPPLSETWCDCATDWATIKITWELTVTVPEHAIRAPRSPRSAQRNAAVYAPLVSEACTMLMRPQAKGLEPTELNNRSVDARACRPLPFANGWMATSVW